MDAKRLNKISYIALLCFTLILYVSSFFNNQLAPLSYVLIVGWVVSFGINLHFKRKSDAIFSIIMAALICVSFLGFLK